MGLAHKHAVQRTWIVIVGRIEFPEVRGGSESIPGPRALKEYWFGAWFMAGRLPVGQADR